MTTLSVSEARAALPEVLDRVAEGEEVTITRHGRPVAVLVRPDILWSRRVGGALADSERIHELLTEAAAVPLPAGAGLIADAGLPPGDGGRHGRRPVHHQQQA